MTPTKDPVSPERVAELRGLLERAECVCDWVPVPYGDGDSLVIHEGADWRVCFMATPGDSPGAMPRIEARADLIAAAVNDLPALLSTIDHLRGEVEARGDILTLIAEGWAVIESDGRLMTIQAPDEWEWANGDEEPRELVIDTYADICTRIVPASGDQVARPQTEAGEPVKPSEEG
jgi:hypothetical protein